MKNIYIPYNNDIELISKIKKLDINKSKYTISFYFAPNPKYWNTWRRLPNEDYFIKDWNFDDLKFDNQIDKFLKKCKKNWFSTNLLLNSVTLWLPHSNYDLKKSIPKLQSYLQYVNDKKLVSTVTIWNAYLLDLINWNKLENINIKTSVNFQIKDAKSVKFLITYLKSWVNHDKLKEFDVQKDLLRNIPELKEIKKVLPEWIKLSLIMNEWCLLWCPYQLSHQVHSSTIKSEKLENYNKDFHFWVAKCKYITAVEPWRFIDSNWILPSQMHYYDDLVDSYKFVWRNDETNIIIDTIKAYILNDYDSSNLNKIIWLMNKEKWKFPESALLDDIDRILFWEDIEDDYYKKIWKNIVDYNKKQWMLTTPNLKGKWKDDLHKFEWIF